MTTRKQRREIIAEERARTLEIIRIWWGNQPISRTERSIEELMNRIRDGRE